MPENFYPRNKPDLSTEQIVKIAESLPDHEQIQCSTVLLPTVELLVFLDNKPSEQVQVGVQAGAPGYAQTALFTLNSIHVHDYPQMVEEMEHPKASAEKTTLSIHDVVALFRLDEHTRWHLFGHDYYPKREQPMILPSYTIETKKADGQFEATVQELGVTVTGATEHDTLAEACRAIHFSMIAEAEAEKQKREAEERGRS